MKKRFWLFSFLIPFVLSSCQFYNAVFGEFDAQPTPDTLVTSIHPDDTEVQFLKTKTSYDINTYWMDALGNRLYKKQEEHYKLGRLHGYKYAWNNKGVLIHQSKWNEGVMIDTFTSWHDTVPYSMNEFIVYDSIGNRIYELNFHVNGKRACDTIFYTEGRRHGIFKRYDETGYHSETYCYSNDTLKYVNVYKTVYTLLEGKEAARLRRVEDEERKALAEATRKRDSLLKADPTAVVTTVSSTETKTTALPSGAADILLEARKRNPRFINIWD